MDPQLGTTNLFLGLMALGSVLEALVVVGLGVMTFVIIRRVSRALERLEAEQVTPVFDKVNAVLDDVKGVSGKMKDGAGRFDSIVRATAVVCQTVFNRCAASSRHHDRAA